MRVLVIPEDPTRDQFILKPIVERLFSHELDQKAQVDVLRDPHLHSISQALDPGTLRTVVEMYPQIDLFLLMVDNDCHKDRGQQIKAREGEHPGKLVGCAAIQEVEVWMLGLYPEFHKGWKKLRAECHPKEAYCEPFLKGRRWQLGVGGGYKQAMKAIKDEWKGLLRRCPELFELLERLREHPVLRK